MSEAVQGSIDTIEVVSGGTVDSIVPTVTGEVVGTEAITAEAVDLLVPVVAVDTDESANAVKYTPQLPGSSAKQQARNNIDVYSKTEVTSYVETSIRETVGNINAILETI